MSWFRSMIKHPGVEVGAVVIIALIVAVLSLTMGFVERVSFLDGSPNGYDLADLGPSLLILSGGLGVVAYRRWKDSERQRRQYRGLTEVSPSPIVVYDTDWKVLFANVAAVELMRAKSVRDLVGRDARSFVHPDSATAIQERRRLLERDGSSPFADLKLVRLDGTPVAAQVAANRTTYDGVSAVQLVIQDVSNLRSVADQLQRTTESTITAMARLAETRDPYTSGHQERVSAMACRIAKRMGLPDATCETIRLAGIVHDIGKMNVPAEILSKPGRLTAVEFQLIQEHAERGYEMLKPIDFPWPIAEIVREHHERLDGSGYPRGLTDGAICIEARVLAVADTAEAISSHRPYRAALGTDHALDVLKAGRGVLYCEACVDAALALAAEDALFEEGTAQRRAVWSAA